MGMAQKTGMDMNINIILFIYKYKYQYRNKYIPYYGTVKVLTHCHETQQEATLKYSAVAIVVVFSLQDR